MEVWDLLRPSMRRLTVLGVVAVLAALGAVAVEHARAAEYDGRVSVYFAQALGVDTTSNSVDPTADQLVSVLQLPSVEASAAAAGGIPLHVVHAATFSHSSGSPIINITTQGSRQEATEAAPALAAAGLEYFARQGVVRAQSLQASATADLTSINAELADFTARAGAPDVDAAVAAAAVALASAPVDSTQAKLAAANLDRLRELQPQFDLLTTEVTGARTSVSQAYSAVGAAQGVAKAVELPGNVVTAPVTPASRITAYLRAAVGAAVVVVVLGAAFLAVTELRRRRMLVPEPAVDSAAAGASPKPVVTAAPPPAAAVTAPSVLPGDFPVLATEAIDGVGAMPRTAPPIEEPAAPPADASVDSVVVPPPSAPTVTDPYLSQAQRFVREQQRHVGDAQAAEEHEIQRRALRDALQRVERDDAVAGPAPSRAVDYPEPTAPPATADEEAMPAVHPRFAGRARAQIRVLTAVPDPVDDGSDGQASAGS